MEVNLTEDEFNEIKELIMSNLWSNAPRFKALCAEHLDEIELKAVIRNDLMTAELAHIANSI